MTEAKPKHSLGTNLTDEVATPSLATIASLNPPHLDKYTLVGTHFEI
jgi:hypothetical protein